MSLSGDKNIYNSSCLELSLFVDDLLLLLLILLLLPLLSFSCCSNNFNWTGNAMESNTDKLEDDSASFQLTIRLVFANTINTLFLLLFLLSNIEERIGEEEDCWMFEFSSRVGEASPGNRNCFVYISVTVREVPASICPGSYRRGI